MTDHHTARIKSLVEPLRVKPGSSVDLPGDFDPGARFGVRKKGDGQDLLRQGQELLAEYQDRLAAQDTYGVLVVLQAMDAAGKDGTIRHVMSGVNPQGVRVTSFKQPSAEELRHDYLWRQARSLPARGEIGIFNRSHYEEVLVVRVHPELSMRERLPPETAPAISGNAATRRSTTGSATWTTTASAVVKLFLNVSREEQRSRFLRRIDQPEKNWKFSASDVARTAVLGRLPACVFRDAQPHQHGLGALVRAARRSQMVHPGLCGCDHRADADRHRPALPGPGSGCAAAARAGQEGTRG